MGQIIPGTLQGTGHFQRWAHHALDIMNHGPNNTHPTGFVYLHEMLSVNSQNVGIFQHKQLSPIENNV